MNFDPKIKYYLIESRSGKYISTNGLVEKKDNASIFDIDQLRTRFGVSAKATNAFVEKLSNSGYIIRDVVDESERMGDFLKVVSDLEYKDSDILYCYGRYEYDNDEKFINCVYCPIRGVLRQPKNAKGQLRGVELRVLKVVGEAIV